MYFATHSGMLRRLVKIGLSSVAMMGVPLDEQVRYDVILQMI